MEGEKEKVTTVLDPEDLEKSWDESVDRLKNLLSKSESAIERKEVKKEVEEEVEEPLEKSLTDYVAEDDEEAEMAMDVEPFLKSLAKGIEKYIDGEMKKLQKSVGDVYELSKAQADIAVKVAELQKGIDGKVERIGGEPVKSNSVLSKSSQRFAKGETAKYSKAQMLRKSFELLQAKKITPMQATKIEGRVNKNLPLPDELAHLFEGKEE